MVANFNAGGAAINQIAKVAGAMLLVVPIDLDRATVDFTEAPAMEIDAFLAAVEIGYRTVPPDGQLLAVGEMGIGNTTSASALCAALLGGGASRWIGRGTGVDDEGLERKRTTGGPGRPGACGDLRCTSCCAPASDPGAARRICRDRGRRSARTSRTGDP
jgi:NaMN:DMB phosphoribosyltransferase